MLHLPEFDFSFRFKIAFIDNPAFFRYMYPNQQTEPLWFSSSLAMVDFPHYNIYRQIINKKTNLN
jgi:hypothetical protein